jgi:hypothetical protein
VELCRNINGAAIVEIIVRLYEYWNSRVIRMSARVLISFEGCHVGSSADLLVGGFPITISNATLSSHSSIDCKPSERKTQKDANELIESIVKSARVGKQRNRRSGRTDHISAASSAASHSMDITGVAMTE